MSLDIDVAIVAYRRWDLTKSCLEHLSRQTVPHRITVCDNGCDEGTSDHLAREFPEVHVVRLPQNMSYPIACNAAVAAGDAPVVVMMNNDVDARPEFLAHLVSAFTVEERVGSATCLLLRPGEQSVDSAGLMVDPTLAAFPRFQGEPPSAVNADDPVLAGPAGAAVAFRRAAWQEVGGLDEALPAYMEDLDLALRLRTAGWGTTFARNAVAVHIGSATFGKTSAGQRRRAGYGRGYLLRRYGILRSRWALRAILTEMIVIVGDLLISRDLEALRGRAAGWRGAAGLPRHARPPVAAIDDRIGLLRSLQLRRSSYED